MEAQIVKCYLPHSLEYHNRFNKIKERGNVKNIQFVPENNWEAIDVDVSWGDDDELLFEPEGEGGEILVIIERDMGAVIAFPAHHGNVGQLFIALQLIITQWADDGNGMNHEKMRRVLM